MDAAYLSPELFVQLGPHSGLRTGGSAAEQTIACLTAIHEELQAHGLGLDDVVNVHVLLAAIEQKHGEYNPAYNDFFHSRSGGSSPAGSTAGTPLAPGELVRMTAIAALGADAA